MKNHLRITLGFIKKLTLTTGMVVMVNALVGCATMRSHSDAGFDHADSKPILYSLDKRTALNRQPAVASPDMPKARGVNEGSANDRDINAMVIAGKSPETWEAIRKDLRAHPNNTKSLVALAFFEMRSGNDLQAELLLNNAGGCAAQQSEVVNLRGVLFIRQNNVLQARACFDKSVTLDPANPSAHMNLAVLDMRAGRMDQAKSHVQQVLSKYPNHSDAKVHLAGIMLRQKEPAGALQILGEVLKQDDRHPLALFNMALAQRSLGKLEDAKTTMQRFVESQEGHQEELQAAFTFLKDVELRIAAAKPASGTEPGDEPAIKDDTLADM